MFPIQKELTVWVVNKDSVKPGAWLGCINKQAMKWGNEIRPGVFHRAEQRHRSDLTREDQSEVPGGLEAGQEVLVLCVL